MSNEWDKMKDYLNRDVELCMSLDIKGLCSFIDYWSGLYKDKNEYLYEENIKQKELDKESMTDLFLWKNGGKRYFSERRIKRYLDNYKTDLHKSAEWEEKYLVDKKDNGGAIWNIFYLHVLSKNKNLNGQQSYVYPIFDQHVYRAMRFMEKRDSGQRKPFKELEFCNDKYKFKAYVKYRKFYKDIENDISGRLKPADDEHNRKIDRALFWFGKLLKTSCNHSRYF